MPDGCYNDAYSGMQKCYQSGEIISQHKLTPQEHQTAIQIEMLKQQQSAQGMQMFSQGVHMLNAANPPVQRFKCIGCDW